jgi:ubiquinone/menaquinone biosynthesis C-methylase UbiE
MKLNRIEKGLMNNPIRAALQRYYEGPLLVRLGGRIDGKRALEIGCGNGRGTEFILTLFGAAEVVAVDLDPDMVAKAQQRLRRFGDRAKVEIGDASVIKAGNGSFDAVFDFGVIHHIPDWPAAVSEVRRVLRPDGLFFFEEVTKHALDRWGYRTFLDHPKENRFSGEEFVAECERQSISVMGNYVHRCFGDFVIGVGRALLKRNMAARHIQA